MLIAAKPSGKAQPAVECKHEANIKIECIIRSKERAKHLGFLEGFYPIKHIGIKVTHNNRSKVYHLQKANNKTIKIIKCSEKEFSSSLGVKSITRKNITITEFKEALKRMQSIKGRKYVFGIRDCELAAALSFRNKWNYINRQLVFFISIVIFAFYWRDGRYKALYIWDHNQLSTNLMLVNVMGILASIFFIYLNYTGNMLKILQNIIPFKKNN